MKLTMLDNIPTYAVVKDGRVVELVQEVDLHTLRFTRYTTTSHKDRVLVEDQADAVVFSGPSKPVRLWCAGKLMEIRRVADGFEVEEAAP